jgi:TonB family protein
MFKHADNPSQSNLFAAATCLSETPGWFTKRAGAPRVLSIALHVFIVSVALIPWAAAPTLRSKLNDTAVVLYTPADLVFTPVQKQGRSGGGGGGGKHELTPASRGPLPRGAERQFVPPDTEPPKNPSPDLVMEPTIVAPQLSQLRPLTLYTFGDPNGVVGPPSSGTGTGGGIGDQGNGHGLGNEVGPGGPGRGEPTGCCGDPPAIGGKVSAPTVVYRVEPEYSEEARKARHEGTVVLQAIVRKDGKVDVLNLVRGLGYGLDQNAIEALKKWRFRPAMQNGSPVDSTLNIEVRFNLR